MNIYILCANDRLIKAYKNEAVAQRIATRKNKKQSKENGGRVGQIYYHVHDVELHSKIN